MRNFVLHIYHAGKEGKAFEAGFRGGGNIAGRHPRPPWKGRISEQELGGRRKKEAGVGIGRLPLDFGIQFLNSESYLTMSFLTMLRDSPVTFTK